MGIINLQLALEIQIGDTLGPICAHGPHQCVYHFRPHLGLVAQDFCQFQGVGLLGPILARTDRQV